MPQPPYTRMTQEEYTLLLSRMSDGAMGDDEVYACNAQPADHLHVRRLGDKGTTEARVGIMTHTTEVALTIFLTAGDARSLAETLLSVAEEMDGVGMVYDVPDDLSALFPDKGEEETA